MINLVDDDEIIVTIKNKRSKVEKKQATGGKGKASFFLSKEQQSALERDLQIKEDQEREFQLLLKRQEKEARIQLQFQQQQADRKSENIQGRGSGVNPFFVIQQEQRGVSNLCFTTM